VICSVFPAIYSTRVNQLGNKKAKGKKKLKKGGRGDQSYGIKSESGLLDIHSQHLARNP